MCEKKSRDACRCRSTVNPSIFVKMTSITSCYKQSNVVVDDAKTLWITEYFLSLCSFMLRPPQPRQWLLCRLPQWRYIYSNIYKYTWCSFSLSSGGDTIQRKWRCCVVPLWLHSCFRISINFILTIHSVFLTSWSELEKKIHQKKIFNIVCAVMCLIFDFIDTELRSELLHLFEFIVSRKLSYVISSQV